jgi:hypothetical protein
MTSTTDIGKRTRTGSHRVVSPSDDELLAKNLPRPDGTSDSSHSNELPAGSESTTDSITVQDNGGAPTDPQRIRPVELENTHAPARNRPDTPVTDATDPQRMTASPDGSSPDPVDVSFPEDATVPRATDYSYSDGDSPAGSPDHAAEHIPCARLTGQTLRFPSNVSLIPAGPWTSTALHLRSNPKKRSKGCSGPSRLAL